MRARPRAEATPPHDSVPAAARRVQDPAWLRPADSLARWFGEWCRISHSRGFRSCLPFMQLAIAHVGNEVRPVPTSQGVHLMTVGGQLAVVLLAPGSRRAVGRCPG